MHEKVGTIQGHDVLYVPEKNMVFCKNTILPVPVIKKIIRSSLDRTSIPEKELVIIKDGGIIHLGCLTTTLSNCNEIIHNINKIKK